MALAAWAVPQLAKLLPIDEESLGQIITYTDTLSRPAAAEHLRALLGDSPQALEFISSFQTRRPPPPGEALNPTGNTSERDVTDSEVPRPTARSQKKKKEPFNKLPPLRQVEDPVGGQGTYVKKAQDDYMPGKRETTSRSAKGQTSLPGSSTLQSKPDAVQLLRAADTSQSYTSNSTRSQSQSQSQQPSRLPPSAIGPLISDVSPSQRSSSPATKNSRATKINITGGTPMHGASTALADLDSAIRSLEISTNPTLISAADNAARRCNCMAQRHPLLKAVPNCLSCGKIICAKEGLGPCTFCSTPLLSQADIQAMLRSLKEERGRERMEANNASHRRAEISKAPRPFSGAGTPLTGPPSDAESSDTSLALARAHRDKLLAFQAQNAKRTQIHDEAADFETPDAGTSAWATPQERALQLKKQQQILREQEWNARPEYEKRQMVVSLDVDSRGRGKAVRKMVPVERTSTVQHEDDTLSSFDNALAGHSALEARQQVGDEHATGQFSRNPLLGALIRPVFTPNEGKGKQTETNQQASKPKASWRRVQDDNDDNEQWILDGGAYGERIDGRVLAAEKHAYG